MVRAYFTDDMLSAPTKLAHDTKDPLIRHNFMISMANKILSSEFLDFSVLTALLGEYIDVGSRIRPFAHRAALYLVTDDIEGRILINGNLWNNMLHGLNTDHLEVQYHSNASFSTIENC